MSYITENSPWHRERNVAAHTDMVVAEFCTRSGPTWDVFTLMGALGCAFHDTAKSMMEVHKNSTERGDYTSYAGHEQKSARLWEKYWTRARRTDIDTYFPELNDVQKVHISWLIEYHVPWNIKRSEKRLNMARTVSSIFGSRTEVFYRILLADSYGRISDDYEQKQTNAENWIFEFTKLIGETTRINFDTPGTDSPVLILPVGASGCGKTTYFDTYANQNIERFSWDDLRLDWYVDGDESRANEAFQLSIDDKRFVAKTNAEFMNVIKQGNSIYVDNTNLTKKRRAFYCNESRKKGYRIRSILFPMSMDELLVRQEKRSQPVPEKNVRQQYMALQVPSIGEVDELSVISGV